MLLRLVAGLVLAGLMAPDVGRAWTRAQVREVHARLDIEVSGRTHVALELTVEVRGGRLERLELPGLDEDLRLTAALASVTLESGESVPAQATVEGSVLSLGFARRDRLRRGVHRLRVHYTTDLAARAERQRAGLSRLTWTLPGWEAALTAAEVVAVGPSTLRAVADPELAVEIESSLEEGRRRLRFTRLHVPRASPWQLTLELPTSALAGTLAAQPTSVAPRPAADRRPWGTGLALGCLLAALMVLGRRGTRTYLATLQRPARPLLRLWRLPSWLLGALALLMGACWRASPAAAACGWLLLIAVSFETAASASRAVALGRFEPLRAAQLRRLLRARAEERLGLGRLEPASWLGVLLMLAGAALGIAAGAFAATDPWGLGLLCAMLAFVAASRFWQPRSMPEQLELLVGAAAALRVHGCALSLLWYVAGATRGQPRLRILPRARYAGLLRIELLVDTRRGAPALVLSVLAEVHSPSARWTRSLWPDALCEQSKGGSRVAILKPVDDLSRVVESLLEHYTREGQRSFEPKAERAA